MRQKFLVILALVALAVCGAGAGAFAATAAAPPGKGHTPVTICHKPGTPAEHTLVVDDNAVKAHLAHGDYLGPCKGQTTTPTTSTTRTVTTPTTSTTHTTTTPSTTTTGTVTTPGKPGVKPPKLPKPPVKVTHKPVVLPYTP